MKEYYIKNDLFNAEYWLDKGLQISSSLSPADSIYVYEFKVYNNLIKGFGDSFEDLILNNVLPFLKEKQLHYEQYTYLKILAKYYYNIRKYKLAAKYFDYASIVITNSYME
ncbi:hypothetical protein CV093_04920 [Oceanobacillus sp. 143]|nr:hypothetical protein CV093_04920 [Oceanobacillus sp. 143]